MKTIKIGSRESELAVHQAQQVMEAIHTYDPSLRLELITMKTSGDKELEQKSDHINEKGLFVHELDIALEEGRVDLAVHSCKDLPTEEDPKLPLVAFSAREDCRDVLVLPDGMEQWDLTRPVGCSSPRRALQFAALYPQVQILPVRGNVPTRLRKLDAGEFSALILAAAGLKRLGLSERISRFFPPEEILPAAGQGVIAVRARAGEDVSFLDGFHDAETSSCVTAERAFIQAMEGGCSSPSAAYAVVEKSTLFLQGMDERGKRDWISGAAKDAFLLGKNLAQKMRGYLL